MGLAAALQAATFAVCAAEVAPLREEVSTEHYDIHGDNVHALGAAIREDGPMAPWGQRVAGYTTADIHWWLRMVPGAGGCRLANADVRLVASVTLPRWLDADRAPAPLQRRWPAFLDALARHEDAHLQLMRESADRVRAVLANIPPAATCDALEASADDAARAEVRRGAALNREFDARTRHGRSEGVDLGD